MIRAMNDNDVEVLLVGTFHLASPGRDLHNPEFDDMLAPRRQAEIEALAQRLGDFRPTAVAVEWFSEDAPILDERYRAYCSGEYDLTASESEQVGFRVARAAGIERLLPIDADGEWYDPAVEDLTAKHDDLAERWRAMFEDGERDTLAFNEVVARGTVGEAMRWLNTPESRRDNLGGYLTHNLWINEPPDELVGAGMVSGWFLRNMRIAALLDRLVVPGDRVLVIFGAGHAPLLEYFWSWNPRMKLVDPLPYLSV